jgi:ABC-type multidrug transport system ATPase subunit
MEIILKDVGKRYQRQWIFRSLNETIMSGERLGIVGSNGSGKSTLLRLLSGAELPTEGELSYSYEDKEISAPEIYKHLHIATPYSELPQELSVKEMYCFQKNFTPYLNGMELEEFVSTIELSGAKDKLISELSSGMQQRLKLGLALLSRSKLVLLDEPCVNFDNKGRDLYKKLMEEYGAERTILIASNRDKDELNYCNRTIDITNYK